MLNSKKVLFVLAHYDDESFCAGTIKKMLEKKISVHILIMCGEGRNLDDSRGSIFNENLKNLFGGAWSQKFNFFDLTLSTLDHSVQDKIKKELKDYIYAIAPDTIITHSSNDLHDDHKWVSQAVRIITRPSLNHKIKKLYECYIPGSFEYGNNKLSEFSTIVDIADSLPYKSTCVNNYNLSAEGVSNLNGSIISSQYFGMLNNMKAAEIYKPLYIKE